MGVSQLVGLALSYFSAVLMLMIKQSCQCSYRIEIDCLHRV